jgi:hypothetical protein
LALTFFAEHVIDCDASQLGTACGKVFTGRAGEKRLRSRGLRAAETNGVKRALQERLLWCRLCRITIKLEHFRRTGLSDT